MLGSPFIFNPILWVILLTVAFFGNIYMKVVPQDEEVIIPASWYYAPILENKVETFDWDYDNVNDDLFALKNHYKIGTDTYVFKATDPDIPCNQLQDVVFTDEKGNRLKIYLHLDSEGKVQSSAVGTHVYEYTFACKTSYPDKTGYWEADEDPNIWVAYLPIEERTGPRATFTLVDISPAVYNGFASFTYYVNGKNGKPKAADQVTITYRTNAEGFTVLSETHTYK